MCTRIDCAHSGHRVSDCSYKVLLIYFFFFIVTYTILVYKRNNRYSRIKFIVGFLNNK
ncbi:hypothetical protein V1478_004363 [Vespula squamosa]|uniref:Uncharacterized protein n=1 Tax=Vespula squamosa TaxID=30214 RepID=A0ABD2BHK1_VESSQ